jgi:hypothetical protein
MEPFSQENCFLANLSAMIYTMPIPPYEITKSTSIPINIGPGRKFNINYELAPHKKGNRSKCYKKTMMHSPRTILI